MRAIVPYATGSNSRHIAECRNPRTTYEEKPWRRCVWKKNGIKSENRKLRAQNNVADALVKERFNW
jgi:hypothetical protein